MTRAEFKQNPYKTPRLVLSVLVVLVLSTSKEVYRTTEGLTRNFEASAEIPILFIPNSLLDRDSIPPLLRGDEERYPPY